MPRVHKIVSAERLTPEHIEQHIHGFILADGTGEGYVISHENLYDHDTRNWEVAWDEMAEDWQRIGPEVMENWLSDPANAGRRPYSWWRFSCEWNKQQELTGDCGDLLLRHGEVSQQELEVAAAFYAKPACHDFCRPWWWWGCRSPEPRLWEQQSQGFQLIDMHRRLGGILGEMELGWMKSEPAGWIFGRLTLADDAWLAISEKWRPYIEHRGDWRWLQEH